MQFIPEKKLSKRILVLFIFTSFVLILQGFYNIYSLNGVNNSITKVYDSVNQVSATASDLSLPISELRQLSMSLVMASNDALREQIKIQMTELTNSINVTQNQNNGMDFLDLEAKKLSSDISTAWEGYLEAVDITIDYVDQRVRIAEFISVTIHEKAAYDKVTLAIVAYNDYQLKISAATFKSAEDNAVIAFWAVLITTVVEVLVLKVILTYVLTLVRHYIDTRKQHAQERSSKNEALEKSAHLKLLLEERTQAEEKIRHLRNYLIDIIDSMPSVLIGVDQNGNVTLWNSRAEKETGISAKQALGHSFVQYFPHLIVDSQQILSAISTCEKRNLLKRKYQQDGVTRYEDMTIYPLVANGIEGAVILLDDITEKHTNEIALRRAQKMEAIGQLTGGIAHDFNNILGIILGNLQLLETLLVGNEKALNRVDKAMKGALRGADITRRLLTFSRQKDLQSERININTVLANLDDFVIKSLTVSIEVQTKLSDGLWQVNVNSGDLEDVILNLSLNSRDAMPEGGILIIETANKVLDESYVKCNQGSKSGDFVMLSVSDNGTGMSEEIKDKVLEPFFTTKGQGKGTGLGLSMVYGFVQRSGGHIKIYSELGEGTSIQIFLPKAEGEVQTDINEKPSSTEHPIGTETILVVDDEVDLLDVTVEYLSNLGYSVLQASDAKQALKVIESNSQIDLVFSDIIMPGDMDGYKLAEVVHKQHPTFKILLASGFTKQLDEPYEYDNVFMLNLMEKRLHKPYNQSELAIAIRRTLTEPE